jgi:SAM-dependent methyltransferase
MRIEYHRTLIADQVRNRVLYEALKAVIEPGKTRVADIGAGTGLLGAMAARLGAREVFLYETAEVAGVAEAVIAASGLQNCVLMPCHSTEMQDPPQVDVIISETLGNYAFEEDIITTLNDARHRFLTPGGVVLPRGIVQYVAPVIAPRLDVELRAWEQTGREYGLDLGLPQVMSFNNVYVRRLANGELLAAGEREWDRVDLCQDADPQRSGRVSWEIDAPAVIYGFAVWWQADFGEALSLSTGPEAAATHWEQLYFPVEERLQAEAGMQLRAQFASMSSPEAGTHLAWSAELAAADGQIITRQDMDLDRGYLP